MSQCNWNAGAQQDIVAITSPSEEVSSSGINLIHSSKLAPRKIAGIAIGGLAGLLILLAIITIIKKVKGGGVVFWKMREEEHELEASENSGIGNEAGKKVSEIDGGGYLRHEINGYQYPGHEIDGRKIPGHELGAVEPRYELSGNENTKHELPALEYPGGEMPVP